ncbi:MAG: TRAP transporter substrate-binding protein [Chloroflexi bacterium]|nr:TRAP transporter substrate-binding protein [Chloroflexota bacterium]
MSRARSKGLSFLVMVTGVVMLALLVQACAPAAPAPAQAPAKPAAEPTKASAPAQPAAAQPTAAAAPAKAAAPKYTLRLAHHVALTHLVQTVSEKFAETVSKKTNGQVEVKVFGAGQIGGLKDNTEGVKLGTLDLAWADLSAAALYYDRANIISLPFLFRDHDHWQKVANGPIGKQLASELLEKTGIRTLSYQVSGFRVMMSRNKPINSAADMKGLKIRIPEVPIYVDTMKALGANATPLPWGDVYTALQTGVVDAVEVPADTALSGKIPEVAKYVSKTYHIFTDVNLIMSDKVYKGLPADIQKAIDDSAKEVVTDWGQAEAIKLDKRSYDDLVKAGMQGIDKPDMASFQNAVKPVWDNFITTTKSAELVKAITDTK